MVLCAKQVLAQPWVPPEGAVLSVNMPSVPAGSKLLSISTQGVQPDADSGLDSPAARSPRVPLLPCPALGLKPQGDVIPSGVHVPSCPTSGLVQPDAEMGLGEPQGDVVPSSVHVPTCPTSGPDPQGDVVPLGPQGDVVPSSVHVPTCPTSGPNPQGDVVPLGVLSRPPGEDEPACEKLAYETMRTMPLATTTALLRFPLFVVADCGCKLRRAPCRALVTLLCWGASSISRILS